MFVLSYDKTGRGMGDEMEVARFITQSQALQVAAMCMEAEGRTEEQEENEPHWLIDEVND